MTAAPPDDESARLEGLGYTSEFKRKMSLSANFPLRFSYLRSDARHGDAVPTREGVKE